MPLTAVPVRARPGALSVDLALAVVALKRRLAYRLNWIFGVVLGGGQLLVSLTLSGTILAEQGSIAGYDWDATRTYDVIGFANHVHLRRLRHRPAHPRWQRRDRPAQPRGLPAGVVAELRIGCFAGSLPTNLFVGSSRSR